MGVCFAALTDETLVAVASHTNMQMIARSLPMMLESLRNDLVRQLVVAQPCCRAEDYGALAHRVMRFLKAMPAIDTPLGYREVIRQGTWILSDIHRAVAGRTRLED
jgi:hypothetical protein